MHEISPVFGFWKVPEGCAFSLLPIRRRLEFYLAMNGADFDPYGVAERAHGDFEALADIAPEVPQKAMEQAAQLIKQQSIEHSLPPGDP